MGPITTTLITVIIATIGRYQEGRGFNAQMAIAAGFLALFLAVLGKFDKGLARVFSYVVMAAVTLHYGSEVFGITDNNEVNKPPVRLHGQSYWR